MASKKSERKSVSGFNAQHLADLQARGLIRGYSEMNIGVKDPQQPAGSKYKNKKVEVDGRIFDSKKEAARYLELRMMERAGLITDLKTQVAFLLIEKTDTERKCEYRADFVYYTNGQEIKVMIVEDVKSKATRCLPTFVIKRKLMLEKYGIAIKEV